MSIASREALKRWRAKNPKKSAIYRKTFKGYFSEVYSRIRKRCAGGDPRYLGFEVMSKDQWKQFLIDTSAHRFVLFSWWVESGYKLRMSPSIERLEPKMGYIVGNCTWLPQWENSSKGGKVSGVCKNRYLAAGK